MNRPHERRRIAVVGGGISGLAAAHKARELDPAAEVTLFEAGPRLGGVLQTTTHDGFLIERSADNFITSVPWAIDLCRRIGFADRLIETNEAFRRAFIVRGGRLHAVPAGFLLMVPTRLRPLLSSPLLSWSGKLRACVEPLIPGRRKAGDESLSAFARRRFGNEVFERLIEPLVSGIYTADPDRLSMQATFSRFVEMERVFGSLVRAGRAQRHQRTRAAEEGGARYSMFVAPRDGMASMVEAIAAHLPREGVFLNTCVKSIKAEQGAWHLKISGASQADQAPRAFDGLILATPTRQAAQLLRTVDSELADDLEGIAYAGTAVVAAGYRREQIRHPLDGFGFVVPAAERRKILAGSFSSVKFPGRAPPDKVLIRAFVGGERQPELLELDDDALASVAADELAELLRIEGPPLFTRLFRWPASMPQYHLGHCERIARIESRVNRLGGLALAGNAYHGVGIPHCIRSGEEAAERALAADAQASRPV